VFIALYLLWIFIPKEWSKTWPYEPPQKYWAAALPAFFFSSFALFMFCIYPALHSLQDGKLYDMNAITDSYAKPIPPPTTPKKLLTKQSLKRRMSSRLHRTISEADANRPIPPAGDLSLEEVNQLLYLKH
jgi:hypothetical protein